MSFLNREPAAKSKEEPAVEVAGGARLVPRITIQAFCENSQTAQLVESTTHDRRMSKVALTTHNGGLEGAIETYKSNPTPNLVIIETMLPPDQIPAARTRLAEVCDATTRVVVLGHVNDVLLYRELIRSGVSEYLVLPTTSQGIVSIITELFASENAAPIGRTIGFIGAKGGAGASTIAHNVGWAISQRQSIDTIITDLDLAFGTAALNFNQDGSGGIMDALGAPDRVDSTLIDRLMTKLGSKLSLLNGPSSIDRDISIEAHAVETILNVVRFSAPIVIVDVPNMWAPWIKYTLLNSDEIIITATPELPSLRNTKNLVDMLKASRPNDKPPRLILNQVGVPKRPEIPVNDFAKAVGITPTAVIPHDPQTFGMAQGNGQMVFEVAPKSKAAEVLGEFARNLAGNQKASSDVKKSGSLFSKLPLFKKK